MLPIRTILHPTDFSERSAHAFRLACALARDYDAELLLVHVVPEPVVVFAEGVVPADPVEFKAQARGKLQGIAIPSGKIREQRLLLEGDPAITITQLALEKEADLIVMGTHGWTGLSRLLMGSVAENVVRKAPCPVLTVKLPFVESDAVTKPAPEIAMKPISSTA